MLPENVRPPYISLGLSPGSEGDKPGVGAERVSVETEPHRLSVSGKSDELSLVQVLNKLLLN